jgi:hypothetical protein
MRRSRKRQAGRTRITEYVWALGENARKRHYHEAGRGEVRVFTVQLEVFLEGKWQPVVRYDSAHGFAHRDRYFLDGRSTKTNLDIDFKEALTFADEDIRDNWQAYRDRFLRGD